MKKIKVNNKNNNVYALVDDDDYEKLSKHTWLLTIYGYARSMIKVDGKYKNTAMHRLIMKAKKGMFLDHINGNKLDNRKENLRFCSLSQNNCNRRLRSDNTSGYKGVTLRPNGVWQAKVSRRYIGTFQTKEEAARAYNEEAKKLFGEFCRLNVVA